MAMYGALTAILSNMENDHYLKHVLSRIDFLKEFSSVTKDELDEAKKFIRPNPNEPIIRKDREWKPVMDAFAKILEMNENLPEGDLSEWIESVKTWQNFDAISSRSANISILEQGHNAHDVHIPQINLMMMFSSTSTKPTFMRFYPVS